MKIFIDAGHRNNSLDYGAIGNGQRESALALSICNKLKNELEKFNIICYMSRTSEEEVVSLSKRTTQANNLNVDLFLSVHTNSSSNLGATGVEVLYYSNFNLADKLSEEISIKCNTINRGAKERKDLHVLTASRMPAILIECGFISSSKECTNLSNSAYQDKIVSAIVDTIIREYKITIDVNIDLEYEESIKLLNQEGIINTLAAWQDPKKIKIENVPFLIKNMGRYIKYYIKI